MKNEALARDIDRLVTALRCGGGFANADILLLEQVAQVLRKPLEVTCPQCSAWTRVLETRIRKDRATRRRYECGNLHRFTTIEQR